MTLPQQLEPFTVQDNPQVTVALKYGKLPYTTQQGKKDYSRTLLINSVLENILVYCSAVRRVEHARMKEN